MVNPYVSFTTRSAATLNRSVVARASANYDAGIVELGEIKADMRSENGSYVASSTNVFQTDSIPGPILLLRNRVVEETPQGIQIAYRSFVANPHPHILMIAPLGCAGCDNGEISHDQERYINERIKKLVGAKYKITVIRTGKASGVNIDENVREIVIKDVRVKNGGAQYLTLPDIARDLALLTMDEARMANVKPWNYYVWYDALGTDGGFVGQMLEQFWKYLMTIDDLRSDFESLIPYPSSLKSSDLYATYGNDLTDLYVKLGEIVLDAWKEEQAGGGSKSITREVEHDLARWIAAKLGWQKGQLDVFMLSRYLWAPLDGRHTGLLNLGRTLFSAGLGNRVQEPAYKTEDIRRLIWTPQESDRFLHRPAGVSERLSDPKKWRVIQKSLLGFNIWRHRDEYHVGAASMFANFEDIGRLPHFEPAAALGLYDTEMLYWIGKLGISAAIHNIPVDPVEDPKGYAKRVNIIVFGGTTTFSGKGRGGKRK